MRERHGTIWWPELMTRNAEAARAHYGALCGWEWHEMPGSGGTRHVAVMGGRRVAGLMDISGLAEMAGMAAGWLTCIAVDDLDAALRATEERGGRVLRAPWDAPGVGRIAIIEDPSGAAVGLLTPWP